MDDFFMGVGVGVEQTFDDLLLLDGLRDNLRDILGRNLKIAYMLRVDDDDGPLFTKSVATGPSNVHLMAQTLFLELLFKTYCNFSAPCSMAGGSGTECDTRFIRVPF